MAYISKNLSELTAAIGGAGQRLWFYWTADSQATVAGAGYISDAANKRMQVGDIVWAASGTLNATGPDQSPSTYSRGTVSEFAAAPSFVSYMVDSITAGAATLKATKKETVTDNSGGTANAATGVVATLATQTFVFRVDLPTLANAQAFQIDPGFNGKITAINFRTGKPATTAAKAATLTASIASVNITAGGVVALTSANSTPTGAQVAGSAVTAQAFTSAQSIGFNVSAVTTFVEGDGYVEITVVNTDLANAIATLIAF